MVVCQVGRIHVRSCSEDFVFVFWASSLEFLRKAHNGTIKLIILTPELIIGWPLCWSHPTCLASWFVYSWSTIELLFYSEPFTGVGAVDFTGGDVVSCGSVYDFAKIKSIFDSVWCLKACICILRTVIWINNQAISTSRTLFLLSDLSSKWVLNIAESTFRNDHKIRLCSQKLVPVEIALSLVKSSTDLLWCPLCKRPHDFIICIKSESGIEAARPARSHFNQLLFSNDHIHLASFLASACILIFQREPVLRPLRLGDIQCLFKDSGPFLEIVSFLLESLVPLDNPCFSRSGESSVISLVGSRIRSWSICIAELLLASSYFSRSWVCGAMAPIIHDFTGCWCLFIPGCPAPGDSFSSFSRFAIVVSIGCACVIQWLAELVPFHIGPSHTCSSRKPQTRVALGKSCRW